MTRQRRSRVVRAAGLAGLCVALAWLDLYLYTGSNGPVEPVLATEREQVAVAPLPPEPSFAIGPLEHFSEIVERPIFSQGRRLPEVAPATVADPEVASLDFVLEGVVITPGQRLALFRPETGGQPVRVPEGGKVRGWAVVAVQPYSVTIRRGEEEATLELKFKAPSPAPAGPARRATRRRASAPPAPATATTPSTADAVPVARPRRR
jgi:hypothetical protein